jgi:GPH family glycoside/pentoside/hexuronide:cation symporter
METENTQKKSFFDNPLLKTRIKSANVKLPEMLIGYLAGPFGALLASGIFTAYLARYWTDVLFGGNTTGAVSTFLFLLPLLSAILIVVGNLVVGQLIERTKTSAGKARPWILLSSVLLGGSCILMFTVPLMAGSNAVAKMVLTAISYNLYYSVAYPMYNTANSTLVPLSTRNSSQRSGLASFVNFSHLGVMGVGSMIFPTVVSLFLGLTSKSTGNWAVAFIVVGIISFAVTVLQYYFTRERVTEETMNTVVATKTEKLPLSKQVKACVQEPYWWIILGFYFVFQFAGAIKNLSMSYFCSYVIDNTFWGITADSLRAAYPTLTEAELAIKAVTLSASNSQTVLAVLGAVPMAVAMAFIWPLSRKFSKQLVVLGGCVIGFVGGLIAGIFPTNFIAVCIGVALKCFGSAPACYMILAMISDMLDHMEAKNGFRCDGFTMSVYSSLMVASTPVMTAIFIGAILPAIGYDSEAFTALVVAGQGVGSTALTAINVSYVWIETIAYAVCAVLLIFFVVEKNLKEDQAKIRERQKAEVLAAGGVWEEPEDRLKREEAEAEAASEAARIEELKATCAKKGLNFEEEEAKYQAKLAAKKAKAEAKKKK